MKVKSLLEAAAKAAVPVLVGKVAGTEAGMVVAAGLGAGAGGKAVGKVVEARSGRRAQKVLAPLAAVGGSAAAGAVLGPEALEAICGVADALCSRPELLAAVPGLPCHSDP